ncbi:2-succinyl-5-enolpyruvyl-6-hydroxy-3-cyclohexene-1-carboxylic-acid synthase [Paraeggerthella hongkongensis]|uniref:2-succinyl-5-enolpyruvyl-6-hydroxy-3-cyclohexene-1-carboxylic-acid synthase n=2 Tax=Paraeggerthella hongkongensis TaxID=230658 RepID=A0A3N0BDX1_9ACTN|nr:2-succinyl-5-enolpyruvyl-6-hydroxy-3-cyclohexene-1-carboxylic-acid synthase [Paraeggerthella hongkongensis]
MLDMYTTMKNVQILLSLLKQRGICRVVHSPGGSNVALSRSIQNDPFFIEYSVVDERSSVFFAMGLAMELDEPVVVLCTSGTAVTNFSSGMAEAYYKGVPVVAVTADRSTYLLDQLETQKLNQTDIFKSITKCEVTLPVVQTDDDAWYCNRLVNEALLELYHHGAGPVHINVPTVGSNGGFSAMELPSQRMITRLTIEDSAEEWLTKRDELLSAEKVLVVMGENGRYSQDDLKAIEKFAIAYDCVVSVEHMSPYKKERSLITYRATEAMTSSAFEPLVPDLVINVDGNIASVNLKDYLRLKRGKFRHWSIMPNGKVRDVFKGLTDIFECSPRYFFNRLADLADSVEKNRSDYYVLWQEAVEAVEMPELPLSHLAVAKSLACRIPENSLLELGILNSTRTMQFFDLDPSVKVSSNIGALGIDGSLSTLIGRSVATDALSFIIQGDLSFFYDMNALNIRHVPSNLRVLVVNNGGGGEFHIGMNPDEVDDMDTYLTAAHSTRAEGWARSRGFKYLSVNREGELDAAVDEFVSPDSEAPVFLEVFTSKFDDAELLKRFYKNNSGASLKERALDEAKQFAKSNFSGKLFSAASRLGKHNRA